jgi:hypothetical protein
MLVVVPATTMGLAVVAVPNLPEPLITHEVAVGQATETSNDRE